MGKRSEKQPLTRRKLVIRIVFTALNIFAGSFLAAILFSPYGKHEGYDYNVIRTEMIINASADSVFSYLGNSDNASEWSVFVAKIEPLNADRVPDGSVGCRRRCYGRENSTVQWDELTMIVQKNKRRQLTIHNMKNFPLTATGLATEQQYFPVARNKTRLVFTVFYTDQPTFGETLKTYFAAYRITSIFEKNLHNIRLACEGKKPVIDL